ncbi:hypothetical protein AUC43_09580 [Hymenobacter sedentarius]|uniref:Helix-turn-helix domain-containing protein n=1 Tax=Hymenobacter sedentarius TaxID=1411621 RepID=A0A0U4AAX0_9BACT|nr:helix-turn-helix domain-containing protein [Hymenobacter sedentarius]ALW85324.1 hypothetical protein AUC43_09580 [Hymenobacter sedentarius]
MQITLNLPPDFFQHISVELLEAMRRSQAQLAPPAAPSELLTTQMVAARLRRCTKTVNRYIRSGKLHAANYGSPAKADYRVSEKDFHDFYAMNCR